MSHKGQKQVCLLLMLLLVFNVVALGATVSGVEAPAEAASTGSDDSVETKTENELKIISGSGSWQNPFIEAVREDHRKEDFTALSISSAATLAELEEEIHTSFYQRKTAFQINYTGDSGNLADDLNDILDTLFQDDYLLYTLNNYQWGTSGSAGSIDITFTVAYLTTLEQENYVDEQVDEILLQLITPAMTPLEQIKAINDYIVLNSRYSFDTTASPFSAYALLAEGKGVCQGYALLAYKMLQQTGHPVRFVVGTAGGGNHAWNLVEVGGQWYHLDVTWNDPLPDRPGQVRYKYFLLNDAQIEATHFWEFSDYPPATGSAFDYFHVMMDATTMEDYIYFSHAGDNNHLYKSKVDGTGLLQLNSSRSYFLVSYDGLVYYSNYSQGGYLYNIKTDGSENTMLVDKHVINLYIDNGLLYYTEADSGAEYFLTLATDNGQPLGALSIGDRLVDNSWQWEFRTGNDYSYQSGNVSKPVVWIVVARDHYGEGSGVTLLAEELIGRFPYDNSTDRQNHIGSNHWGDSGTTDATQGLRPWLNSTGIHAGTGFYQAFSGSFKNSIITATLPNIESGIETPYSTEDNVFIPSTTELGDLHHSSTYPIGTVFPYFDGAGDTDRQAQLGGGNLIYWTRSPDSFRGVRCIFSTGGFAVRSTEHSWGMRPAVNLNPQILVSELPNGGGVFTVLGETDPEKAATDRNTLTGDVIRAGNPDLDNVKTDLALVTAGPVYQSAVSWTSDRPDIVAPDGSVSRPEVGVGDIAVTLEATITNGTASVTKLFYITVKGQGAGNISLSGEARITADHSPAAGSYTATLDEELAGVTVTFTLSGFAAADIAGLSTGTAADLVGAGLTVQTGSGGDAVLTITFAAGVDKSGILAAAIDASDPMADYSDSDSLAITVITVDGGGLLRNLQIGDRVADPSWQWHFRTGSDYSGTGATGPVIWIVVAKDHYGEGSGVTLLAEELIGRYTFDNSTNRGHEVYGSNHWGDSGLADATRGLRPWLNSTGIHAGTGFYQAFSDSFKHRIITTTLPNKERTIGSAYDTEDNVFIPSNTELGDLQHAHTYPIGTVFPYFDGAENADRIAQLSTTNGFYWTRSPNTYFLFASYVAYVSSDGSLFNEDYNIGTGRHASFSNGYVRPALNLNADIPVAALPDASGVYLILEPSDTEQVATDKHTLTGDIIRGGNLELAGVKTDLALVTAGAVYQSTISWASDRPDVVASDGSVSRPEVGEGDIAVALEATIINGEASDTKVFNITVRQKELSTGSIILSGDQEITADNMAASGSYIALLDEELADVPVSFSLSGFAAADLAALSSGSAADLVGGGVTVQTGAGGEAVLSITFVAGVDKSGTLAAAIDASDPQVHTGAADSLPVAVATSAKSRPLGTLEIGDRVVDNSWQWQFRTGSGFVYQSGNVTKPVVWIVVAKDHYGEGSGVTLLAEEIIGCHIFDNQGFRGNSNWCDNGLADATRGLRPWLNSTGINAVEGAYHEGFYHAFSESFKSAVLTTNLPNKECWSGNAYTTEDKVFLPSNTEMGDTTHFDTHEIGTVFPYFAEATNADRRAQLAGVDRTYWTRSPRSSSFGSVYYVSFTGVFGT